jgi:hypothetical protein
MAVLCLPFFVLMMLVKYFLSPDLKVNDGAFATLPRMNLEPAEKRN